MKAPLSWLKEYVEVKSDLKTLMWRMTEIGLTCESVDIVDGDKVLDIEVTPNRPDWLSITGVAREIAIIENGVFKYPKVSEIPTPTQNLPISVKFETSLTGGYAGVTISKVMVKDSPEWIKKKLISVGLRPINNLVDITNYVMFELGIPIHVFDYDKLLEKNLTMTLSKGGEPFVSVDGIKYKLPPKTLIIKDKNRVIDLCGIKGGANTGISNSTKNIFIHAPVYSGPYIRKTSQKLKLTSDASYIYERGPNPAGIKQALNRVVSLVFELAGGEIASKPIIKLDYKNKTEFKIDHNKLSAALGHTFRIKEIVYILKKLEFEIRLSGDLIVVKPPFFRSDIAFNEDVYEEIARIYGLNNFDRKLPKIETLATRIPYFYNRSFELALKNMMVSAGYFEIQSQALTSAETIKKCQLNQELHIRIANPVSSEYEFMRTSLLPSLLEAVKTNSDTKVNLFEYGKVYIAPLDRAIETYKMSAVVKGANFSKIKGCVDYLLNTHNIRTFEIKPYTLTQGLWHPTHAGVLEKDGAELAVFGEINPKVIRNLGIKDKVFAFEFDMKVLNAVKKSYVFTPLPQYPPQIEDLTIKFKGNVQVGKIIAQIKKSKFVSDVVYIGSYENSATFRVYFSNPTKTLTDIEVKKIRSELLKKLG